ncbi:MAG TPA: hypothetical protein VHM89_02425 [Acidimicrobiales bacterium]|nr:hypothetical protein [Acidimicrobiales bacterium]
MLLGATLAVPLWGPTARAAHLPQCMWLIETPNVRGYTARCTGFQAFTGLFAESAYCTS